MEDDNQAPPLRRVLSQSTTPPLSTLISSLTPPLQAPNTPSTNPLPSPPHKPDTVSSPFTTTNSSPSSPLQPCIVSSSFTTTPDLTPDPNTSAQTTTPHPTPTSPDPHEVNVALSFRLVMYVWASLLVPFLVIWAMGYKVFQYLAMLQGPISMLAANVVWVSGIFREPTWWEKVRQVKVEDLYHEITPLTYTNIYTHTHMHTHSSYR